MIKKLVLIFIIIAGIFFFWIREKTTDLTSPQTLGVESDQESTTEQVSLDPPKTFQFDSATDLKMELNKVNPQVLDSDFE